MLRVTVTVKHTPVSPHRAISGILWSQPPKIRPLRTFSYPSHHSFSYSFLPTRPASSCFRFSIPFTSFTLVLTVRWLKPFVSFSRFCLRTCEQSISRNHYVSLVRRQLMELPVRTATFLFMLAFNFLNAAGSLGDALRIPLFHLLSNRLLSLIELSFLSRFRCLGVLVHLLLSFPSFSRTFSER